MPDLWGKKLHLNLPYEFGTDKLKKCRKKKFFEFSDPCTRSHLAFPRILFYRRAREFVSLTYGLTDTLCGGNNDHLIGRRGLVGQ